MFNVSFLNVILFSSLCIYIYGYLLFILSATSFPFVVVIFNWS